MSERNLKESFREKVAILKREPYYKSTWRLLKKEIRLFYSALYSAYADPLTLLKWTIWPKSVDKGIRPNTQWFEIKPKNPNGIGLLLCHGFASTPEIFHDIAPKLADEGYHVRAIRLSGHGTTPGHMAQTSGAEWLATVVWHYKELNKDYDRIFYLGHSLGALLGLLLSTIYPVGTIITMCTPVDLNIPPARFVRQASILVKYWPRSRKRKKLIDELGFHAYKVTPLYAVAGIFDVGSLLRKRANKLKLPVLYIRAGLDHKSLMDQPEKFRKHFPNTPTVFRDAENSPHSLLSGPEKDMITSWFIEWFAEKQSIKQH